MCDECECENTVKHGLEIILSAIKTYITNQIEYLHWKCYLEPKHNRELMRDYGTLNPTMNQIWSKLGKKCLIPVYVDEMIVDTCRKETELINNMEKLGFGRTTTITQIF
jgi:metal-dependent hydrolase (beta-lactamase superfamily II)